MSLAFSEHVLDPGASVLPWNPVSLAVRQHLNSCPLKAESLCALWASVYKAENRALSLHNYPTGSHTRGSVLYTLYDILSRARILLFQPWEGIFSNPGGKSLPE